jgi:ribosome-binding protein aMBF1 (putative translation factor)
VYEVGPALGAKLRKARGEAQALGLVRGVALMVRCGHERSKGAAMSRAGFHERRKAERMREEEFRAEYARARSEIDLIDSVVRSLDELREHKGTSKSDLARRIGRNPSSIRRLFTARSNPELRLVVQIANDLDADIVVVPRKQVRVLGDLHRAGTPRRLAR